MLCFCYLIKQKRSDVTEKESLEQRDLLEDSLIKNRELKQLVSELQIQVMEVCFLFGIS